MTDNLKILFQCVKKNTHTLENFINFNNSQTIQLTDLKFPGIKEGNNMHIFVKKSNRYLY